MRAWFPSGKPDEPSNSSGWDLEAWVMLAAFVLCLSLLLGAVASHRQTDAAAEAAGASAGRSGIPIEAAPVFSGDAWKRGWISGFNELKSKGR